LRKARKRIKKPHRLVYEGCICVSLPNQSNEAALLSSLGVKLGRFNRSAHAWDGCTVSQEALTKLDEYWGRFIWSLHPERL